MKFILLNIGSTKNFYVDKNGKIYNSSFTELKGSSINNVRHLTYIKEETGLSVKESFARLVYAQHYPNESLDGYNIHRKNLKAKHPYKLSNLEKVSRVDSPDKTGIIEMHKSENPPSRVHFYKKFSPEKLELLVKMIIDPKITSVKITKEFNLGKNTLRNRKNDILEFHKTLNKEPITNP